LINPHEGTVAEVRDVSVHGLGSVVGDDDERRVVRGDERV
jgi:hypothetical protein